MQYNKQKNSTVTIIINIIIYSARWFCETCKTTSVKITCQLCIFNQNVMECHCYNLNGKRKHSNTCILWKCFEAQAPSMAAPSRTDSLEFGTTIGMPRIIESQYTRGYNQLCIIMII